MLRSRWLFFLVVRNDILATINAFGNDISNAIDCILSVKLRPPTAIYTRSIIVTRCDCFYVVVYIYLFCHNRQNHHRQS